MNQGVGSEYIKEHGNTFKSNSTKNNSEVLLTTVISTAFGNLISHIFKQFVSEDILYKIVIILVAFLIAPSVFFALRFLFRRYRDPFLKTFIFFAAAFFVLIAIFRIPPANANVVQATLITKQYHGAVHENKKQYKVTATFVLENGVLSEGSTLVYDT